MRYCLWYKIENRRAWHGQLDILFYIGNLIGQNFSPIKFLVALVTSNKILVIIRNNIKQQVFVTVTFNTSGFIKTMKFETNFFVVLIEWLWNLDRSSIFTRYQLIYLSVFQNYVTFPAYLHDKSVAITKFSTDIAL